ncbi:MAG: hypothetical protein K6357_05495 [Elusimicrobiota bacterium]
MDNISLYLRKKAAKNPASTIFPEGSDLRIREAAAKLVSENICKPVIMLNDKEKEDFDSLNGKISIIDPYDSKLKRMRRKMG